MKGIATLFFFILSSFTDGFITRGVILEVGEADIEITRNRILSEAVDLKVKTFGEEYNLHLLPATSIFTKNFRMQRAIRSKEGQVFIEDVSVDKLDSVYQDSTLHASLMVKSNTVDGYITSTIALRPSSERSYKAYKTYFQSYPKLWNVTIDYMEVPEDLIEPRNFRYDSREENIVYPEIYVIVDSALSSLLGDDDIIKDYLSVFWNAVNQRYAGLKDPQIGLRLAGALIIKDSADEPFITSNILLKDYISGEDTLNSVGDWLFEKKDQLPKYDIAYLMTGKNMAFLESGKVQDGLAGMAWQGAACLVSPQLKRSFNTAVGEDIGAIYSGVLTAAHEVAHTLGAPHDGGDGAENCLWEDGYIMSYVPGTSNNLYFSPCSQKLMEKYLTSFEAACIREKSGVDAINLSSKLPGEIISMDEQCQKITGKSVAYTSKSVTEESLCAHLVCQWQERNGNAFYVYTLSSGQPAAEGSACRSGGRCIDGKCR